MQIKDIIKEQILTGKLKKGDKIPSEKELCQMFGVSRITVRQAISEAINEGLLFTVQGKGTFVSRNGDKIDQGLVKITSFESAIKSKGLSAGTKVLGHKIQPADFALCKILNLDITDGVFNLNLLGTADGQPFVFYNSYFQVSTGMKFYQRAIKKEKEGVAFSTIDLYREFEDLMPIYAEQTFEAVVADKYLAEILKVNEKHPLFLISSIIYTKGDIPVEYKKAFYRGDKYKFHIRREML